MVIVRVVKEALGVSTGRHPSVDEETWWWSDEAKDAIRTKKQVNKKWDTPGRQRQLPASKQGGKERSMQDQERRQWPIGV